MVAMATPGAQRGISCDLGAELALSRHTPDAPRRLAPTPRCARPELGVRRGIERRCGTADLAGNSQRHPSRRRWAGELRAALPCLPLLLRCSGKTPTEEFVRGRATPYYACTLEQDEVAGLRASRGWCGTAADGRLVLIDPQRATARNRHTARMKRRCSRVWQAKYLARSLVVQSARVRIHAARRNLLRIAYDRATRSLMPTQASGRNYLSRAKNTLTRPTTTHRRRAHASRTSVPRGKIRALDTSHHAVASAAPPAPIALVEFSRSAGIVRVARRTPSEIDLFQANHAHAPTRHKITRTQDHTRSQEHTRSALHIRGE